MESYADGLFPGTGRFLRPSSPSVPRRQSTAAVIGIQIGGTLTVRISRDKNDFSDNLTFVGNKSKYLRFLTAVAWHLCCTSSG